MLLLFSYVTYMRKFIVSQGSSSDVSCTDIPADVKVLSAFIIVLIDIWVHVNVCVSQSDMDQFVWFPFSIKACFDVRPDANPKSRQLKLSRFPENPEVNWGPKARAKGSR